MGILYNYDFVKKDVLIRTIDEDPFAEILHKGDKQWSPLVPEADNKDEEYCRAIWLGQGCWENLTTISEEEAEKILKDWGYYETKRE